MNMEIIRNVNNSDVTGFLPHFMIGLYYGVGGRMPYLGEPMEHYGLIVEKYGVFDECWPMAESILGFINGNKWKPGDSNTIAFPHCSITKCVQIDVDDTTDGLVAGYDYISSEYNEKERMFNKIVIVISFDEMSNIKLGTIMHELQHAKEDVELRRKGGSSVLKASEYGLSKLSGYAAKDELEKKLRLVLYYFSSFERNAYVNSIHAEIDELKKKHIRSPKEIYDYIRKCGFYKRYLDNFSFCESVLEETDPVVRKRILDVTNNMSNNRFSNWHQFKHWLKNKVVTFKKKFDEIIPKIIFEELENNISYGFGSDPLDFPEKYRLFFENNNIKRL